MLGDWVPTHHEFFLGILLEGCFSADLDLATWLNSSSNVERSYSKFYKMVSILYVKRNPSLHFANALMISLRLYVFTKPLSRCLPIFLPYLPS